MSKSLLGILRSYSTTWIKIYEGEEEGKIRYQITPFLNGFIVSAYHIAEEPNCDLCVANLDGNVPCNCTSTYMQSRCMKKEILWTPENDTEVFAVMTKLGGFENNFDTFSLSELNESYDRFTKIFSDKEVKHENLIALPCKTAKQLKYYSQETGKTFKILFY